MAAETFLARLDRVPLNRFHWRLLAVAGVGSMFDAMDVILIAFLLAPIRAELGLDVGQTAFVGSAGFVGMLVGAALAGRAADRFGRKQVFEATLLLFSFGALLSAVAPSFETLLVARVIAGLGLGGELPVGATLVSEYAPRASRGRLVVLLESFWAYGAILAGVIALLVLPQLGWRGAFVVGALPALYVAFLRRALPESPRFLAEHGRAAEADAVVRRVEREGGGALITVARPIAPERSAAGSISVGTLVAPRYARRTALLGVLWFGLTLASYGTFRSLPAVLGGRGLTTADAYQYFFIAALAQVPGYLSAAWLVERLGRRATLISYLVGSAVAAFLLVGNGSTEQVVLFAALLSFFTSGAGGVAYALSPELYPTAVRATGAGVAAAIGRIGALVGPVLVSILAVSLGDPGVTGMFIGLLLVTAAAVGLFREEPRGRSLEELSPAA